MPKYENFSKEELLRIIEKQEQELAQKKYGLVWDVEREPEQVVLDCANNLPVLKRVKGKEIKTCDEQDNILIEGDNYHALTVLNYTHKEKIDVIYIDPPYNTEKEGFIYNDKKVDENDGYRHSKWLNFMEKRLNLAKELLNRGGVCFISIDDNEYANLKLLLDKIFYGKNFVASVSIYSNPRGRQSSGHFAETHEYLLVYAKNKSSLSLGGFELTEKQKNEYNKKDKNGVYREIGLRLRGGRATAEVSPTLHFPIYYDEKKLKIHFKKQNNFIEIIPKFSNGVLGTWRWSKEKIKKDDVNLIVRKVKRNNGFEYDIFEKNYLTEDKQRKPKTSWIEKEINYDRSADEQKKIFGLKKFDYAKPVFLLKKILKIINKDIPIVLDFFAGSGTTGHAVLELNKEDGGNRNFILCSNNENNNGNSKIMDDICYPRIQKVIKGYKKNGNGEKVEGLSGNLQYFKTAMVKKTRNKDQVRLNLTRECTEMLCVKENIFNLEAEADDYKIFSSNKKDKYLCVYYNFLDDSFDEFLKKIKKLKGQKIVYMFSTDDTVNKNLFAGVKNLTIKAIPQRILDIYKQLVKINIPVKKELIFLEFNKAKVKIFDESEKDEGARILRIVLEKTIQKIAQANGRNIYNAKGKEEKIFRLNDFLKKDKIFSQVEWEETKTYLTIGNHASHGEYGEYDLEQAKNFYKNIQNLLNKFNI